MTRIKLCGITRLCDIEVLNHVKPEYIGFVFAQNSRRYVTPDKAYTLKSALSSDIKAVGVFVDAPVSEVAGLLENDIIDIAQLHGHEDEDYIRGLKALCNKPVIKAFRIGCGEDLADIDECTADYVLLDSGAGSGESFDWGLIKDIKRPYFLAGGLSADNVRDAINILHPFAVDASSGIETGGFKDEEKIRTFIKAVRG
ncbi:MAG: phosphoribosylanthranilate isomerase [Coprococcus sp.]|nr:phosphoribosylanthranilate isomerase [Coprococcus sp.]